MNPVELSQRLIHCPSITPRDEGALGCLEVWLNELGFHCTRLDFGEVSNLHARWGCGGPHLAFAGHTDVVPVGDEAAWTVPPFEGLIKDDALWGRGSEDMKCAIACFISALHSFLKTTQLSEGSISLIITGDEEGPALQGTQKMLGWMKDHDQIPDFCIIGEPAARLTPGDRVKVGRRGSVTAKLTCFGQQGHIAYPHLANNPLPRLIHTLTALQSLELDSGNEYFEPSNLEITSVDVGNEATNVIPNEGSARFGIRFNTLHEGQALAERIRLLCQKYAGDHKLDLQIHGNAFLNQDEKSIEIVSRAISNVTGVSPELCTRGGTSDGRFLIHHCPVIEVGMVEKTMHQVDEHVPLQHINHLMVIYSEVLKVFFGCCE